MLLSNLYRHIAFPGRNSMLSFLKSNMGTDPTRAKHQTMKIYIKALCFLNSEGYFSRLTTQKYRLTAIAAIVPRLHFPNAKISNAWKRQTVSWKIHLMVHGAKNEEISKDGHDIGNSKQNCFSPSKGFSSHSKLMGKCVGDHRSRPMNKKIWDCNRAWDFEGASFLGNCGAASVGEYNRVI